jgi:hypothetical protein
MSHQTILAEMTLTPGQFTAIAVFYVIAGLICLGIGALNLRNKHGGSAALSILIGIAGVVYGAYILIGDPETVWISFKIFILPVIAIIYGIVALVKGKAGRSTGGSTSGPAQAAPYNAAGVQPGWNQPGQPMPGQPVPGQPGPGQMPGQPMPGQPAPGQVPGGRYGQGQPAGYPPAQPGGAPSQPAYGQPVAQQQWGQAAPQQPVQRDPQSPPPPPAQTDQPLWPGQNQ